MCGGPRATNVSTYRHCSSCARFSSNCRKVGITGDLKAAHLALKTNGPVCRVCGREGKLNVDHDHETGEFRGILCYRCNIVEGYFKDAPDALLRLREYILRGGHVDRAIPGS